MRQTLRIIHDDPQDGPTNMARDEALLTLVGEGQSPPTLRTYLWSPPTISLGYFQRFAEYEHLDPPAGRLPVVRRQTGGGAILHDSELTYSITLPLDHPLLANGPHALYEIAHDALIHCLKQPGIVAHRAGETDGSGPRRGPFFCFARRHALDVLIGNDKLAGSAQRRTRRALLQHGSIMLGQRYDQQPIAVIPSAAGLHADNFRPLFTETLIRRNGLIARCGQWTEPELTLAVELGTKYRDPNWTRRS